MATTKDTLDPKSAWQPFEPSPSAPWTIRHVGHLYRRAAFGATWDELQAGLTAGPRDTITALLQGSPDTEGVETQLETLATTVGRSNAGLQASAWWIYRMLYGAHPLREKLTLFWHNHFATSVAKVRSVRLMLGQYELLRKHALGHFSTLLTDISVDPAMLVWLDTAGSKKGMPNENYARELMELFSLGIGTYTEHDIRAAAKAFTGWDVKREKASFNPAEHDGGSKTVFGKTGNWKGADVVRLCLDKPCAATFVVTKLTRFLIGEGVAFTPELLAPLADEYRSSDYDTGALVETILRSQFFFTVGYRASIKSPVDYTLGLVRALEGRVGTTALAGVLEQLGQNLFAPPSVKGWDGGPTWLNGQTLLTRQNFALAVTSTDDPRFGRLLDPATLAERHQCGTDEQALDFFAKLFLQDHLAPQARERLRDYARTARTRPTPVYWTKQDADQQRVRTLCHLVLLSPEYQLA